MSFGVKNATSTYQQVVNQAFQEYLNDFVKKKLDDFNVYNNTMFHIPKFKRYFIQCQLHGISFHLGKKLFLIYSRALFWFIVAKKGKFPNFVKIQAVVDIPTPNNVKEIKSFNRLAQFSQCFIYDYVFIKESITQKDVSFYWSPNCTLA